MIDITAEITSVREEQWGSRLRGSIADGLEKLAKGAADVGTVSLAQLKAEEAYNAATSAKTDAQNAKSTVETMQTQLDTVKADVEILKNGGSGSETDAENIFFVDNESGNDSNDGKSAVTAWKTLKRAMQMTKKYQIAYLYLTGGQSFSSDETMMGVGTGVIVFDRILHFRSTSETELAIINSHIYAFQGMVSLNGVQTNGVFKAACSNAEMQNCKISDLLISSNTSAHATNCEYDTLTCDFSEMRMTGCTVTGSASADNCSMVYTDSSTTIASKTTNNGGMFYVNGIPETQ